MNVADEKAWKCLTTSEQQSLSLSISYGKSTWEVGEILKLSHYKYLELKERSEKLFKLFFEYFSLYNTLVRPNIPLSSKFVDFIEACIERRISRREASTPFGDSAMYVAPIRTKFLVTQLNKLKASKDQHDIDLLKLLQEFDRWNNWRILPRVFQQPSAYKRRTNRREVFYIKYMCNMDPDVVQNIIDRFWYSYKDKPKAYCALFDYDRFDDGYKIVPVKESSEFTISELSRLYIYVFKDRDIADTYGYLVTQFQYGAKDSKKGQTFWPTFRETIKKAVNYNQVNNLEFYTEQLDMAYELRDKKLLANREKRENRKRSKGERRADSNQFYI